jgi:hypothetical protein
MQIEMLGESVMVMGPFGQIGGVISVGRFVSVAM